ncbi:MAG TPA: hypothetical protein VH442_09755 [Micromonosporaceae bacterium]|jgi:hypothetical protein
MPTPFVAAPPCAECGQAASHVELIEPATDANGWRFVYSGPGGSNGGGDDISVDRADRLTEAFAEPLHFATVATAGLYDNAGFCERCDAAYCGWHWNITPGGYGTCPRGHRTSLDPQGPGGAA